MSLLQPSGSAGFERAQVAKDLGGSEEKAQELIRLADTLEKALFIREFRVEAANKVTSMRPCGPVEAVAKYLRVLSGEFLSRWAPARNSAAVLIAYLATDEGRHLVRETVLCWSRQHKRFPLLSLDDLEQDAHLHCQNLWSKAPLNMDNPKGLLFTNITRRCSDLVRRQKAIRRCLPAPRPNIHDTPVEETPDWRDEPQRNPNFLDGRDFFAEIRESSQLDAHMLRLYYELRTYEEIGREVGRPRKYVEKRINRALDRIRCGLMLKCHYRGNSVEDIAAEFNTTQDKAKKCIVRAANRLQGRRRKQ